jgi:SAM-dependent methyltransferase/uncharacterized protein YbaR (Trm112 family)
VKESFPGAYLRCPACRAERTLALEARESNPTEVREGTLTCRDCGRSFPLHRGVAELMIDAPEHVRREAAGLERFAEHMRNSDWDRERILALPDIQDGYWFVQLHSFEQVCSIVRPAPGQSLLDVGSNTCWATNRFAQAGLHAIALDISTAEMQGLYTADWFLEEGAYFERILGTMNDMPIASSSLDYVFCCEVLHHNDPEGLRRTFGEAYRVLRPGGRLLVVNETLRTLKDPSGVHVDAVQEFDGYEHAHWALQYWLGARRAGFRTQLLEPVYHWFFDRPRTYFPPGTPRWEILRGHIHNARRRSRLGRSAQLAWLNLVEGGVSFSMIATKPDR